MDNVQLIVIPLDYLISDNSRHGLQGGRIKLTTRYRQALHDVGWSAKSQWSRRPLSGPVAVEVTLFLRKDGRGRRGQKTDILNYSKLIFDALEGVCYEDDHQIVKANFNRVDGDSNPRVEILISELE